MGMDMHICFYQATQLSETAIATNCFPQCTYLHLLED